MRYKCSCVACGLVEYSDADAKKPEEICVCGMPRRVIALTEGEYREEVARSPGEILTDHIYSRSKRAERAKTKSNRGDAA